MVEKLLIQKNLDAFETHYHSLRLAEERIYSNDEIVRLPEIAADYLHYNEWLIRKNSSERFINFLKKKNKKLNILEAGCGNGWLAAKMSEIRNTSVTGIDINRMELMQAVTVFDKRDNLHFVYGDINSSGLTAGAYDVILFASSLQYFSSLNDIINAALKLLTADGEIHIIDTPFYHGKEINNASRRTTEYYAGIGFQEMKDFYFHRSVKELRSFNYKILYNPSYIINRFKKKDYPFHWIVIKK